ncbi:MAG: hypothetical protein DRN05_06745 [Thermoplasmata archaeon]|nr:MAG: hypothetical protein DRN05_06745 [Thermoplasmata archaeon]
MALPKPKQKKQLPKKKEEIFQTSDNNLVAQLVEKGFHVVDQKPIGGKMVYTFAEPKSLIEKA